MDNESSLQEISMPTAICEALQRDSMTPERLLLEMPSIFSLLLKYHQEVISKNDASLTQEYQESYKELLHLIALHQEKLDDISLNLIITEEDIQDIELYLSSSTLKKIYTGPKDNPQDYSTSSAMIREFLADSSSCLSKECFQNLTDFALKEEGFSPILDTVFQQLLEEIDSHTISTFFPGDRAWQMLILATTRESPFQIKDLLINTQKCFFIPDRQDKTGDIAFFFIEILRYHTQHVDDKSMLTPLLKKQLSLLSRDHIASWEHSGSELKRRLFALHKDLYPSLIEKIIKKVIDILPALLLCALTLLALETYLKAISIFFSMLLAHTSTALLITCLVIGALLALKSTSDSYIQPSENSQFKELPEDLGSPLAPSQKQPSYIEQDDETISLESQSSLLFSYEDNIPDPRTHEYTSLLEISSKKKASAS